MRPRASAVESQVVEAMRWADEDDQLPQQTVGGAVAHLQGQITKVHRKIEILETQHTKRNDKGDADVQVPQPALEHQPDDPPPSYSRRALGWECMARAREVRIAIRPY